MYSYKKPLVGEKYGKLTVIGPGSKCPCWTFRCDCGRVVEKRYYDVMVGKVSSCGCLRATKDGEYYTGRGNKDNLPIIYNRLRKIIDRCYNPANKDYVRYGGRGIRVCDEWLNDWKTFHDWCKNNGWDPELTIDRIDNDGPYSPENCRFVNRKIQSNNRRNNHILVYNGESHTMSEWSDIKGWPSSIIKERVSNGWTVERTLNTPIQENKRHYNKKVE